MTLKISEADVKLAVGEWLQFAQNQGKLHFERLNAGEFIETRGDTRRRIKGASAGAADFLVLQGVNVQSQYLGQNKGQGYPVCRVTFIEVKKPQGGKQSDEQKAFESKVKQFHARYFIVTSVAELEERLR